MHKKKILVVLTSLVLIFVLLFSMGCAGGNQNGGGNNSSNSQQKLDKELVSAKEAYTKLTTTYDNSLEMVKSISKAWGYAIYYADTDVENMWKAVDYKRGETDDYLRSRFCLRVGLVNSFAQQAIEDVMGSSDGPMQALMFVKFNYTVKVVIKYYESLGWLTTVNNSLTASKGLIDTLSNENKAETKKDDLIDFYSLVKEMYDFINEPSGSYNSLSTTISNFETRGKSLSNKLSFL